jgi:hypothetical protein
LARCTRSLTFSTHCQRWFRRHVDARKAAKQLQTVKSQVDTLVTSWQRVATSGFEDSMIVMQQRELARAAQSVLRVLLPSATGDKSPAGNEGASPSPRANKGAPFRVLLMVGMLAAHPNEIMENNQCDRLAFASKAVLRDMDRIFVCLRDSDADAHSAIHARALKHCVAQLEARFAFYLECFSQWKDRDAQRLAVEMLGSYHDIYRTKLHYTAKVEKEVDHANDGLLQLLRHTEKQLMQLRSAIVQVIGKDDALQRIEAVERACADSNAARGVSEDEMEVEREAEPSPVKPRVRSPPRTCSQGVNAAGARQPSAPSELAPPPAQVESLLGDEKLVHELILNPSFRLPSMADANATETLAGRVRENMVKAFWDQAVATNDVNTLLVHLDELRGLFASVVKSRADLVADVTNALEPSMMRSLLTNSSDHFVEIRARCVRVVQAIRQAEAPARTDTTDAFLSTFNGWCSALLDHQATAPSAIRIFVDFVAFAMDKVEQIRADMINAHLGVLATYLARHGTQYEQQKFHAKLATGAKFPHTAKWLELELMAQLVSLSEETKQRLHAGHATAFAETIRSSMLALVTSHIDGSSGVWPETFALDVDRIRGYRDALDRMTLISTMLVVLQEYIARRRLPITRVFFAKLGNDLSVLLGSPGVSGAHLVTRAMDELQQFQAATNGADIREDPEFQALEARLQTSFQVGNPIFGLFSSRVTSAVQSLVVHGDWVMHPSLAPFETELRELAMAMRKLFQHNEAVHATLYNAEMKKLLQQKVHQ